MVEYIIVHDSNVGELTTLVNSFLEEGWQLQGQLTFGASWDGDRIEIWCQTMIRTKSDRIEP